MSDYHRIAKAISYINNRVNEQPSLTDVAQHLNMSAYHFQRIFSRWAGVTPKRYLQVLTLERAKQLLSESTSVLDTSNRLGLSSGSRLYDHFVKLEAITPGEYKNGGVDLAIEYGVHDTPFGKAFIATTTRGICQFSFLEYSDVDRLLVNLSNKWPQALIGKNNPGTSAMVNTMFNKKSLTPQSLPLHVSGTNFQVMVWKALLQIPAGKVVSYSQIASHIGRPRSARAVGTAIGANPVAFLIPCHRVIRQTGQLGGYHWGETRLHAIHAWESARKS